jgi:SAM-dependent methyltransferase
MVVCHLCGQAAVDPLPDYAALRRITSDVRPWPNVGWLGVCPACGSVQKACDATWRAEVEQIYDQYTIYYQGGGHEQAVFVSGESSTRSDRLVQCLLQDSWVTDTGRLLDIGCGNGALLRVFSHRLRRWSLAGTEINEKYKITVEQIPGVTGFYTDPPDQVSGPFDLVTMIHVLEHIPDPGQLLSRLPNILAPGGRLLIQVPSYTANPFDLLIADHCTHFTTETLSALIQRSGYVVDAIPTGWIPKELSLLAHADPRPGISTSQAFEKAEDGDMAERAIRWLRELVAAAREQARGTDFGLFGTSIAATWLHSEMEDQVHFFVDEDPSRVGRVHMGKPVYHPRDVSGRSLVFIALPTPQADDIKRRMGATYPDLCLSTPPPMALRS